MLAESSLLSQHLQVFTKPEAGLDLCFTECLGEVVTRQKFAFFSFLKQVFLVLADFLKCWQFGPVQRFRKQDVHGSSSEMVAQVPS